VRRTGIVLALVVVVISLIALAVTTDFLVDWAWFSAVGYVSVYWTTLGAKLLLFLLAFVGSTALLSVNGFLAYQFAEPWRSSRRIDAMQEFTRVQTLPELWELTRRRLPWRLLIAGIAGLLGLLVAVGEVSNWEVFLRFMYQVPYGQNDPLYGKDLSFYLFSLPGYLALKNWLLLLLFLGAVMAGVVYWVYDGIQLQGQQWSISPAAIAHGSALLGLFLAV
jgi:uncharacterized membrane protein (UPF0182 family)